MIEQFKTWLVCQFCGRVTPKDDAEHWLNQPFKGRYGVRVVRCPEHWSEWALRNTREGRTTANRARMEEALAQPAQRPQTAFDPFPTEDRDE